VSIPNTGELSDITSVTDVFLITGIAAGMLCTELTLLAQLVMGFLSPFQAAMENSSLEMASMVQERADEEVLKLVEDQKVSSSLFLCAITFHCFFGNT
jgi:hypothetical protein